MGCDKMGSWRGREEDVTGMGKEQCRDTLGCSQGWGYGGEEVRRGAEGLGVGSGLSRRS